MKTISTFAALVLAGTCLTAQAEEPTMKQQMKEDWQEIKDTAGKVGNKAVDLGKKAGEKTAEFGRKAADTADDLTDKARASVRKDDDAENSSKKPGSRFFY